MMIASAILESDGRTMRSSVSCHGDVGRNALDAETHRMEKET